MSQGILLLMGSLTLIRVFKIELGSKNAIWGILVGEVRDASEAVPRVQLNFVDCIKTK